MYLTKTFDERKMEPLGEDQQLPKEQKRAFVPKRKFISSLDGNISDIKEVIAEGDQINPAFKKCGGLVYFPGASFSLSFTDAKEDVWNAKVDITSDGHICISFMSIDGYGSGASYLFDTTKASITHYHYFKEQKSDYAYCELPQQGSDDKEYESYIKLIDELANALRTMFSGGSYIIGDLQKNSALQNTVLWLEKVIEEIKQMSTKWVGKDNKFSIMTITPEPVVSTAYIELSEVAVEDTEVTIKNIFGQEVKKLLIKKGDKSVNWDVKYVSNGTYFCKVQNGVISETGRITVKK